jgi:hypothetical protein
MKWRGPEGTPQRLVGSTLWPKKPSQQALPAMSSSSCKEALGFLSEVLVTPAEQLRGWSVPSETRETPRPLGGSRQHRVRKGLQGPTRDVEVNERRVLQHAGKCLRTCPVTTDGVERARESVKDGSRAPDVRFLFQLTDQIQRQ